MFDFEHLERQLIGQDSRPEGRVRLATTDTSMPIDTRHVTQYS